MKAAIARFGVATMVRAVQADLFLRGIIAFLFGIVAFFWPNLTTPILAILFAAFVLVDGILALLLIFADLSQHVHWWGHLVEGLLGLIIGLITLLKPDITPIGLLYLVVIWVLILGILEIFTSFWGRSAARESWLTLINGLFALFFGLILLIHPGSGALTSIRVIAFYALVLGTMQVTRALRIGRSQRTPAAA